jgi:hypothetical protein
LKATNKEQTKLTRPKSQEGQPKKVFLELTLGVVHAAKLFFFITDDWDIKDRDCGPDNCFQAICE